MKFNKKFLIYICVFFFCVIVGKNVILKESFANPNDINNQINAIIETANAYYRQGLQFQYDSFRKNLYSTPEDATSQHLIYTVCSGFPFQVYYQTFGINIPDTTQEQLDYAQKNINNKNIVLAFYGSENEIYSKNVLGTRTKPNYENLIKEWSKIVKPGDIIVVTGHAMMVYDVDKEKGNITIIDSGFDPGEGRYSYEEYFDRPEKTNGTVRIVDLKKRFNVYTYYSDDSKSGNHIHRLALFRIITDGSSFLQEDGTSIKYTITESALSRLKYPNIDIEKIVKEVSTKEGKFYTNVLVEPGDYITYELTIKNNSNNEYKNFDVIENIDNTKVNVTSKGYGILLNNNGQQLKWTISNLAPGSVNVIKYTVKVKEDDKLNGKIIFSTGKADKISTSKIETLIGNRLNNEEVQKIKNAYNNLKNNEQIEREFINQVYLDALKIDLGISNIKNLEVINFNYKVTHGGGDKLSVMRTNVGSFIKNGKTISTSHISKYIYQNFYGIRIYESNVPMNNLSNAATSWNIYAENEINDRVRMITPDMLYDGDIILLYTGKIKATDTNMVEKSYLYLDGQLVRKVSTTEYEKITGEVLKEFLRNILGENYMILRPSIAIEIENKPSLDINDNENNKDENDLIYDSTDTKPTTPSEQNVYGCYKTQNNDYVWGNYKDSGYELISEIKSSQDCVAPACYEYINGKYVWEKHASNVFRRKIENITNENDCNKKNENTSIDSKKDYYWLYISIIIVIISGLGVYYFYGKRIKK